MAEQKKKPRQPGQGKQQRYMQPSILMSLLLKPSYGYEIIQKIKNFGFVEGQAPPGMIYRHLRQLEEEALVSSEWETEGTGPAKRVYHLTPDGKEVLGFWIGYMEQQAGKITDFVQQYRKVSTTKP